MNPVKPELIKAAPPPGHSPPVPLADVIAIDDRPIAGELLRESAAEEIDGLLDALLSQLGRGSKTGASLAATSADSEPRALPASREDNRVPAPIRKERNRPIAMLIADRRHRSQCGAEETILELYHANLSMYQLQGVIEQLWGTRLSLEVIRKLHQKVVGQIEGWGERTLTKAYPYVFLAGIELRCLCGYEKKEASVLMAMGIDGDGFREVLGVADGGKDPEIAWQEFLQGLKDRGLRGVRLFVGDRGSELTERMALVFPGMHFQTSVVQFHRTILSQIPVEHLLAVERMLKNINASEDWHAARSLVAHTAAELKKMNLADVADLFERQVWDTLNYLVFPLERRRALRSNNPQLKLLRNVSERTRMVGGFSDGASAVHLVSARMRHLEATIWNKKRYPWGRV